MESNKEKLIGIGKLSADLNAQRKNKENKKKEKRITDVQKLVQLAEEKLAKGEKLTHEDLLALRANS